MIPERAPGSPLANLPSTIENLAAGCDFEPVSIGASNAQVFRLGLDGAARFYLKCADAKDDVDLPGEARRLDWLDGRIPAPRLVSFENSNGWNFLLMEALRGKDSTSLGRENPRQVVLSMARALRALHELPAADCPFKHAAAERVEVARERAMRGLVEEWDFHEENRGHSAVDLWEKLRLLVPLCEEKRITHGDACLPNFIFEGDDFRGFVDCGRVGVADPYQDLALAVRSIRSNLGDEWVSAFFGQYGIACPDESKLAFYRLLDEFF